ncbi:uncharacterized protein METZ01_LOCUS212216 [marine metagenome]|uniref:Uncharacterized protein n=1 Tax=marine metagenome TaxID=408172 RepID=A0A382F9R2_9ZZZZ
MNPGVLSDRRKRVEHYYMKISKKLGIKSQLEIEQGVTDAIGRSLLDGNGRLMAKARITLDGTDMNFTLAEEISLAEQYGHM